RRSIHSWRDASTTALESDATDVRSPSKTACGVLDRNIDSSPPRDALMTASVSAQSGCAYSGVMRPEGWPLSVVMTWNRMREARCTVPFLALSNHGSQSSGPCSRSEEHTSEL